MIYIGIFLIAFICLMAIFDILGFFGPSDGAIDAYLELKKRDKRKARRFLKKIMPKDKP